MCALLAPIRPYAYLFAYSAGAHKSIKGHYSFFEMDLTHTGSVMNQFLKIGSNPMVYVVLNGRMTPKQKELSRDILHTQMCHGHQSVHNQSLWKTKKTQTIPTMR
eukprot:scaffold24307_cov144-Skeletonema_marinoi.AAC.1